MNNSLVAEWAATYSLIFFSLLGLKLSPQSGAVFDRVTREVSSGEFVFEKLLMLYADLGRRTVKILWYEMDFTAPQRLFKFYRGNLLKLHPRRPRGS